MGRMPRHWRGAIGGISCIGRISSPRGPGWLESAALEAEHSTQAMSVAGHDLVRVLDQGGDERKASSQGERHEQRESRCDPKAGCAAPRPIAVLVPDMQRGRQFLHAGGIRQHRRCVLERQEGQAVQVVEALQDHCASRAEAAIGVKQDGQLAHRTLITPGNDRAPMEPDPRRLISGGNHTTRRAALRCRSITPAYGVAPDGRAPKTRGSTAARMAASVASTLPEPSTTR
jgi:hypothetical protein